MTTEGRPVSDSIVEVDTPANSPALFDSIPQIRIDRGEADEITEIFDGTYREWGIAVDLDAKGNVLRARDMNLVTGETRVYEPDSEGGWKSYRGRLNSDPRLVAKLNAITSDVQRQMIDWRRSNPGTPIRHWSTDFARRREAVLAGRVHLSPQEWVDQHALTQMEIKLEIERRRGAKQDNSIKANGIQVFPKSA